MNEQIYITEEELEYYTTPQILTEGNVGNMEFLSDEESDKLLASSKWYTIEEFANAIDEEIRKRYQNP